MRLLLVRHADTDTAMRGRCYGRLDVPLSPEGQRQARELAAALGSVSLAAVYSSPLARALDTATAIAAPHGLAPVTANELREIDFGELEGLRYEEVETTRPALFREWMATPESVRFPGGEALADLRARVLPTVAEIRDRHEGQTAALVAHGGVIRVVLADALGLADGALFRLGQSVGGLSVVDWVDGTPVVEVVNAVLYSRP
ncbi:MAG: histidine phosphatase family protein [Gaiellaceae bacterium]